MIVRELSDVIGSWRHAKGDGWESRRIVLADDQMGCSLHDTLVKEGAELHLEYKNHLSRTTVLRVKARLLMLQLVKCGPFAPVSCMR